MLESGGVAVREVNPVVDTFMACGSASITISCSASSTFPSPSPHTCSVAEKRKACVEKKRPFKNMCM